MGMWFHLNSIQDISSKVATLVGLRQEDILSIYKATQDVMIQNIVDDYRLNDKFQESYELPFYNLGSVNLKLEVTYDGRYTNKVKVKSSHMKFTQSDYSRDLIKRSINKGYNPVFDVMTKKINNDQSNKYYEILKKSLGNDL